MWNEIILEINELNFYNKKNCDFVCYFFCGVFEVIFDSVDCILLFKRLVEYVGIDKDMILMVYFGRIEMWFLIEYDKWMEEEFVDFFDLVDEVLGGSKEKEVDV